MLEDTYVRDDVYAPQEIIQQEETDEPNPQAPNGHSARLFSSLASALLRDKLQQLNPTLSQHTKLPLAIRRRCGRWLVLQRCRRGVDAGTIAERAGIDADLLEHLEQGLGDCRTLDEERQAQLALLLADANHDADLVLMVIRVAFGDGNPCIEAVLLRIDADLHANPFAPTDDLA